MWKSPHFLAWRGAALAAVRHWRRYAPAAGSVAAHAAVFLGIGAMMAVAPPKGVRKPPSPPMLAVELVTTDVAPPPRPAPQASAPSDAIPLPPRPKAERQPAQRPAPPSAGEPSATATDDVAAIPLPEGPAGVPLGLRKLLETNPCDDRLEKIRGDCDSKWARLGANGQVAYSPTLEQLASMYPGFTPDGPSEAWMSLHRYRRPELNSKYSGQTMQAAGMMPPGPAGGTGVENIAGRLPAKNWQHQDPVFGTDTPSWLGMDHKAAPKPKK